MLTEPPRGEGESPVMPSLGPLCAAHANHTHTAHSHSVHTPSVPQPQSEPACLLFLVRIPPRLDRDGRARRSFSLQVPDKLMSRNPGGLQCHTPAGDSGTPPPLCAQTLTGAELHPAAPQSRFRSRPRRSPAAPAGAAPRYRPAPAAPPPMEQRGGARGTPGARHGTGLDPLRSARGRRVTVGAVPVRVRTVPPGPAGPGPGALPVTVLPAPAHR